MAETAVDSTAAAAEAFTAAGAVVIEAGGAAATAAVGPEAVEAASEGAAAAAGASVGEATGETVGSAMGSAACGAAGAADHAVDEEGEGLSAGYVYDWDAYHAAFGDTPIDVAVTAMFAEYALLYGRISNHVGASSAPPMTLSRAQSISRQASMFVTDYVNPILGPIYSTKMHKLLRHVLDAIRMHGNLRDGNTAGNETEHKMDKGFYNRTNKGHGSFTEQLLRRSQGTRAVLNAHEAASGGGAMAPAFRSSTVSSQAPAVASSSTGEPPPTSLSSPAVPPVVDSGGSLTSNTSSGMMPAVFSRGAAKQMTYLSKKSVAALASRPGMAAMAELLQFPLAAKVPVLSLVTITAELDCGAHVPQQLRSNPSFLGAPWYDAVLYRVDSGDETGVNGEAEDSGSKGAPIEGSSVGERSGVAGAGGKNSADLCIGEVRAIVRHQDGDYAYV